MTERERKILRGASIAPKTADEAAIAYAMEKGAPVIYAPYDVPFSVTIGEQTTATTTATYADVIAAHNAGRLLRADCDPGDGSHAYYPLGLVNETGGYIAFWGIVNLGTSLAYITITFEDDEDVSVNIYAITS